MSSGLNSEIKRYSAAVPLIVVVGPTASGKTGLAIELAKEFSGEIISADSRAIYKGLDIGTAKPSLEEREDVPHWGIDLVVPGERFTAAEFKQYAEQKIIEIKKRGSIPILVGGTGLYVDAIVYDFEFPDVPDAQEKRAEFNNMSLEALHRYCLEHNIDLPENDKNKRYVINAILRNGHALKRRSEPIDNTIIVGITTEMSTLRARIGARAEQIFSPAVYHEAQAAATKYGWDNEAMTGNIYPLLKKYFDGELTINQAMEKSITLDWRLAKRQLTWLKRNEHIQWMSLEDAYTYLARHLAPLSKR